MEFLSLVGDDVEQDFNRPEPNVPLAAQAGASPVQPDARTAPRFTLLVRTAKLIIDGREYLCVLRDVSATGCKVRLFHPLPLHHTITLEVANGDHFPMELMWVRDDHAGFHFKREVDVGHLIDDSRGQYPKRQIRMRVGYPAKVVANGQEFPVSLRDISQQGACIECAERLMLRQSIRIEAEGFPPITAKVCWRQAPRHGLVFDKGFLLEELAHNLLHMHKRMGNHPDVRAAS